MVHSVVLSGDGAPIFMMNDSAMAYSVLVGLSGMPSSSSVTLRTSSRWIRARLGSRLTTVTFGKRGSGISNVRELREARVCRLDDDGGIETKDVGFIDVIRQWPTRMDEDGWWTLLELDLVDGPTVEVGIIALPFSHTLVMMPDFAF